MIIDFHTHTFPDKVAGKAVDKLSHSSHTVPFTDGTNDGLLRSMEEAGVDISVIMPVATSPDQVEHINSRAISLNACQNRDPSYTSGERQGFSENFGRLLSFGCMHPAYENWEAELERLAQAGVPGIKIHPPYQDTDLDDPRYVRIIKKADELSLITLTHTGLDIGMPGVIRCTPDMVKNVFDKVGDVRLVLAHMGGWKVWNKVRSELVDTPAYLDTSFSTGLLTSLDDGYYRPDDLDLLSSDEFTDMVNEFGSGRILFGTDSPWSSQAESVKWIRATALTEQEKEQILGGNAAKLLGNP